MIRLSLLAFLLAIIGLIVFSPDKDDRDNIIIDLYRHTGVTLNISS